MTLHAITVLGHDRPGIIAETTAALADLGLNLEDSSMTLLRGHFAMTLVTSGAAPAAEVEAALAALTADGSLAVSVREVPPEQPAPTGASYLLSVHGGDRPGIVSAVTAEVARAGGNITDLTTRLAGDLYVLTAECDFPDGAEVAAVEAAIKEVASGLGVGATLRSVESDEL
ncbi:MAG TPA: ACT domain-containing protein [Marmoricola sp.]|nr:ACT domain-containing protein [Marmoricola sp.]